MPYLAHTVHAQFVGFWVSGISWILTIVSIGLVQWRIWVVSDLSVITSGQVWVGIWRVCFFSCVLLASQDEVMYCQRIRLTDAFTPREIAAAQALMLLAFILGFFGNSAVIYGLRNAYFGLDDITTIRVAFSVGGGLLVLAGVSSFIPLIWNIHSVVTNQTINFPPDFNMPPAPDDQYVGPGIAVGILASILVVLSGIIFLSYRPPEGVRSKISPKEIQSGLMESGTVTCVKPKTNCHGVDNLAFESQKDG